MLTAAIDVGRWWMRLVLIGHDPHPVFLEGMHLSYTTTHQQLEQHLLDWESEGYGEIGILSCCPEDPWPPALLTALQRTRYRIEWVDRDSLSASVRKWRSLEPAARWLRASLIGTMATVQYQKRPLNAVYALLRSQALELEVELGLVGPAAPGRHTCMCEFCDPWPMPDLADSTDIP